MCVKTIVLTNPIRFASHAAATCESAFAIRAAKNSTPICAGPAPNLSWKK